MAKTPIPYASMKFFLAGANEYFDRLYVARKTLNSNLPTIAFIVYFKKPGAKISQNQSSKRWKRRARARKNRGGIVIVKGKE